MQKNFTPGVQHDGACARRAIHSSPVGCGPCERDRRVLAVGLAV
ncbi:hypothetical protein [Herbaspirillum sp. RV1423]|nr:hypothetical protein [Herbaspirillum sp. RV1423]